MERYDFYKTKYGQELLIDLIRLETLEKYIIHNTSHVLSYYDITLISEGSGQFCLDENKFPVQSGMIFFTSPMQVRKWKITEVPKGLVLIFEKEFLCTFFNDTDFVEKLTYFNTDYFKPSLEVTGTDYSYLVNLFLNIENEIINRSEKDNHILRALLYQALVWLNRKYQEINNITETKSNYRILDFKKLVDNYFIQQHSVSFYADKLNITPGHLNYLVKKLYGIPAKQYIQNRLFLEAKRLLANSSLSVSEIAWQLNFQDNSYFVRTFKKFTGYTPLSYRQEINP